MKSKNTVRLADNIVFNFGAPTDGPIPPPRIAADAPGPANATHRAISRAELSKIPWQRERLRLLGHIFAGIERRVANGSNVSRELRRAARRWAGRCYKSAPTKAICFSEENLGRWFYIWRNAGRTAASLELNYKPAEEKLPTEFGGLLAGLVLETDALSVSEAIREISSSGMAGKKAPTPSTFWRKVPAKVRRELRGVIRKRYELRRAERRARKILEDSRR